MPTYTYPRFPVHAPPELAVPSCAGRTWPVAIVGAGLAGPTLALDLAQRGIEVLLLDEDDTVSYGSRSVCQAKRTLEIWDRLGAAASMLQKGVTWHTGHIFNGDQRVFSFNLQPEQHHKLPAFINLQQYYVEQFLIERCLQQPGLDLRFGNKVVDVRPANDHVALTVETAEGRYETRAQWLVACDGVRSAIRHKLGLAFEGEVFDDQFLIADIVARTDLPPERHFWFDPPFHRGWSALVHRQADDVMRVDWQLGRDLDPAEETRPERIDLRLKAMFGPAFRYELEWASLYTFTCRSLARYVHGRVIFAGDAAHVVSPFGARGGNGGVQDADNLGWKLALVLEGAASPRLIDSYDTERRAAAADNIRHSTRSTDFITPKHAASRLFRDGALALAKDFPFARALINSGRLSTASVYACSPLNAAAPQGAESDWSTASAAPGAAAPDGATGEDFLVDALGSWFAVLAFADRASDLEAAPFVGAPGLAVGAHPVAALAVVGTRDAAPSGWTLLDDSAGVLADRYDGRPGTVYLIRPDRHVAGRWRAPTLDQLRAAVARFVQ